MTEKVQKIAIFVPDGEAKMFLEYQRHRDLFALLVEKGVFSHKSAAVTLHFDHLGALQAIDKTEHVWNARRDRKLPTGAPGVQKDAPAAQ